MGGLIVSLVVLSQGNDQSFSFLRSLISIGPHGIDAIS